LYTETNIKIDEVLIKKYLINLIYGGGKIMKIIIMVPKGKMGKLIVKAAAEDDSLEVFGVIGPKCRDYIGNDAGVVAGIGYNIGVPITDNLKAIIDAVTE
jgi:dihydrodipicolinate reductase